MDLTACGRRHGETPERDHLIECDPDHAGKATAAFGTAFADAPGNSNLMPGTIALGDQFVQDTKMLHWLQREFAALAAEMEGGAFGYACHLNGLPFVVIRALSNPSGESASDDFEQNLHKAGQNSSQVKDQMIPSAMFEWSQEKRRKRNRTS